MDYIKNGVRAISGNLTAFLQNDIHQSLSSVVAKAKSVTRGK